MRFLPLLLAALPLVAALPAPAEPADASAVVGNERHLGWPCTKSSQCGTKDLYCRRGKCDVRKKLGSKCYKSIGCISNKCSEKRCVAGAVLTLGERCETSKSCASTYCGKSKCAVPQPVGADCYKPAGCLSGICTDHKCAAPATTPNPDPTTPPTTPKDPSAPQDPSSPQDPSTPTNPTPNPPTDEVGNVSDNGHFEDDEGGLAPWQTIGETKRSDVDYTAWDGTHYAILEVNEAGGPGLYQQPYTEPPPTRRDGLEARDTQIPSAYDVSLRYRVNKIANAGAKGCRLAVLYDGKAPDASGVVRYTSASSEWKELRANVKSDEAIQYLFIVMDCPDGGTTTVHIDDVNFVPLAPEEPAFTATDVARNGGFESGKDPWTLVGKAEVVKLVGVVPPDGDYYLRLYREGGTARQLLEMPAGTKVAGFNSYDIKFKYRLDSYYGGKANAGQPACRLDVSYDDEPPTKQVYLSAADVSKTWTELTVTVTNDADLIKAIQIESYCGDYQNALADVYIDVVQVLSRAPGTTTPPTTPPKKDDVCVNGGFEDGAESWTFASDAAIGTSYPKDGNGKKYAVLQGHTKDSISQQVQLPPDGTTGSGGFYQYVVRFEYRVFEYDFGGGANSGTCQIGVSHDDLPIADVDKRTIDSASGWGTYEATLTSDMDCVQNIKISTSCGGMASTLVAVDQVQFLPKAYTPKTEPTDVARNGGFESSKEQWTFAGQSSIGTINSEYDQQYAILQGGDSISQDIKMPDNSLYQGYQAYRVRFKWHVQAYAAGSTGTGKCQVYITQDNAQVDATLTPFDTPFSGFIDFSSYIGKEDGFIKNIGFGLSCSSGYTATIYMDNVHFEPTEYVPPPKTEPTDVARDGDFEEGASSWNFAGDAMVSGADPMWENTKYVELKPGGKVSQTLVMPPRSLYDGYYGYSVAMKWRGKEFTSSGGLCYLYFSQDGSRTKLGTMEYAFGNSFPGWVDFSGPIESEDGEVVKSISIGLECDATANAVVFIDQVSFTPIKDLLNAARNGRFEASDLSPWVVTGTTLSNSDKTAKDGLHYAQLSAAAGGSGATMSQQIVLPARYPLDGSDGYKKYDVKLFYKIVSYNGGTATGGAAACVEHLHQDDQRRERD
ncbi:hypothetical protein FA09DRAFT_356706, partial [Tilletiopsis washingtonensis]